MMLRKIRLPQDLDINRQLEPMVRCHLQQVAAGCRLLMEVPVRCYLLVKRRRRGPKQMSQPTFVPR